MARVCSPLDINQRSERKLVLKPQGDSYLIFSQSDVRSRISGISLHATHVITEMKFKTLIQF